MIIGLPKETMPGETRIALLPIDIKNILSESISFQIETGAGLGANFPDELYLESGIDIIPDVYESANLIIRINPLSVYEIDKLKEGSCLVSLINPFINHDIVKKLAN